eukprot:TRINITY_DN9839_c0_g1::TRINITY_DN9839_c0_g1_i1::g.2934::m.2934 TRINITY_DN9839_c0_g1::TRINITY_DN9839_c0_g1_i1::g.2934  ORF type:complete len:168 (-),score=28.75,sp/Q5FW48/ASPD_XENTR/54.82/3e-50,DUF108/PF01958.13/1.1e-20 TRINITY_DN9839_c0_g1_i1:77-520(-)
MASRGTLRGLTVTMKIHPGSIKAVGELAPKVDAAKEAQGACVVYEGPVQGLCPLAPNNVNTMACAALAGFNLGFSGVKAVLVADSSLDAHIVEVDVFGPEVEGDSFSVKTVRHNPAKPGAVTGHATFMSFYSSLTLAHGRGHGLHFC